MERSSDVDELHGVFPDLSRSRGTLQLFADLLTSCSQPKLAFAQHAGCLLNHSILRTEQSSRLFGQAA